MTLRQSAPAASQGPQITTSQHLADYNVLASFPTMDDAGRAIEALGRAGIEAQRITLQGSAPNEASRQMDVASADARVVKKVGRDFVYGAILGGAVGVIMGAPAGLAALNDGTLGDALIGALFGLIFGGIVGGLIAAFYPIQAGDAWELSSHDTFADEAVVGVHSPKPNDVQRARAILEGQHAVKVRVMGADVAPSDAVAMTSRRR